MDHLVIAHVVQVCSNLQLSLKEVFVACYMLCIFYVLQWHIAESELFLFFFFFLRKGQDLVSFIPYVGVYEVHVSGLFFFQSNSIYM